ncbi:urea carboxylase [Maribacter antarcticus]|uniref:urea carboxylase n=1 Tax=Maribacter antarcticus TaxID=505250 RepID=UPI00047B60A2|nr:urea carboxylase [Maribacter antarcticus]
MFKKVLIANRGAIAVRIIRTLKKLGVKAVVVFSEEDRNSLHVDLADESYLLGSGPARATYLDQQKLIAIAKSSGAGAIHPGYGFLSENTEFAELCKTEGIVFLGPTPEQMRVFGLKHEARALATKAKVPLLPGTALLTSLEEAKMLADQIGYPIILKSTAGGGGIGMEICHSAQELHDNYEKVKSQGKNSFSNAGVFLEKFVARARHIEVQVFGDGKGKVIALGERDCSAQRRNQKVVEEAPATNLSETVRLQLYATAVQLASSVNYQNAGTVEFIFDQSDEKFYFLEMNTRLQVEHGVTEYIFGMDLVEWMVQLGAGTLPSLEKLEKMHGSKGHALQVRIYAESPGKNFQPSAGLLTNVQFPTIENGRIDTWVESGIEVPSYYDPLIAKVIVHAKDRATAIVQLQNVLRDTTLYGIETNIDYLKTILAEDIFQKGKIYTQYLNKFKYSPNTIDIIKPGTFTTIQDYPGRTGYWNVGVPPSGPYDSLSFRLGNELLGNPEDTAGLEITANGPTLKFNVATQIVLTGAEINASLDGKKIACWTTTQISPGQILKLGQVAPFGMRAYCLIKSGINCPEYLGSKSTFTLGQFGGHAGRQLQIGDVLKIKPEEQILLETTISPKDRPQILNQWKLRVIYGPHGAPDFFTKEDIETFFKNTWEVHYNSSRTGVRLIGPKPEWARTDGGEAGMHPSNIHDNAYAIGTVDFTGDMPVILGPDGPSLGGFVCPATVIQADLWKLGQLKAGDKIRFVPVAIEDAVDVFMEQAEQIKLFKIKEKELSVKAPESPILEKIDKQTYGVEIGYRVCGDAFVLIEYGPMVLDINLRFRVHAMMLTLEKTSFEGILELTPGIRSLQVHYNPLKISVKKLLDFLKEAESSLKNLDQIKVPARIVHLPISWNDTVCQMAVEKYIQSVRKDAPWCPDNIEFIRRINGLDSVDKVKRIVFEASYLVMGLGDVYLGAPVATPIDPRHRLVTTKYNPARTWTAENSVGIGGSYLCVYGMEGPGGYQFIGRTLQMWNRYHQTKDFKLPWLLRFFDQIRFYEVSNEELSIIRRDFPKGNYKLKVEDIEFSLAEHQEFLSKIDDEVKVFQQSRNHAFDQELERWVESGQINFVTNKNDIQQGEEEQLAENEFAIQGPISASILKIEISIGQTVLVGDALMTLESMKMEFHILAEEPGIIKKILKQPGEDVKVGQDILILEKHK